MDKKRKSYFKEFLSEKLNTLVKQAGTTVTDMTGANAAFPDPADRASLETDRNFELRLRDREHKLIKKRLPLLVKFTNNNDYKTLLIFIFTL
jgi:DnaK suppressor protein